MPNINYILKHIVCGSDVDEQYNYDEGETITVCSKCGHVDPVEVDLVWDHDTQGD